MLTFCQQNWREIKWHSWKVETEMQEELATQVVGDIPSQADLAEAGSSGSSSSRPTQSSQSAQVPFDSDSD